MTIVGMRHYADSHEKIIMASKKKDYEQCLFLVPEVNNKFDKNAVMLHDGRVKLGYVASTQAAGIRQIVDKLTKEAGQDHVLVVKVNPIKNERDFNWSTSFNVVLIGSVYERIARKHAQGA